MYWSAVILACPELSPCRLSAHKRTGSLAKLHQNWLLPRGKKILVNHKVWTLAPNYAIDESIDFQVTHNDVATSPSYR